MAHCARYLATAFLACRLLSPNAQAGEASFTGADLANLTVLSAPSISPDGKYVAVIIGQPNIAENRIDTTLMLVDARTGAERIAAHGDISAPAWSPDGATLAWLAPDANKASQINLVPLARIGSPPLVATHAAGVESFAWSPGNDTLAYAAEAPPTDTSSTALFNRSFEVPEADVLGTSFLAAAPGPRHAQIWLAYTAGGKPRLLAPSAGYVQSLAWRPDASAIVFTTQPGSSAIAARQGSIVSLDVKQGTLTTLVAAPAYAGTQSGLTVSSQGEIAYEHYSGADPWTHANNAAVVTDGHPRDLTISLDRNVKNVVWRADGSGVLVSADDFDHVALWSVSLSGAAQRLDLGAIEPVGYEFTGSRTGAIAFVGSTPVSGPELYVLASPHGKPVALTHENARASARHLGRMETISWQNDGFTHDGVLTVPPDFDPGKKYPLLVNIHGGPEFDAFATFNAESQFFAGQGWVVFEPNYRGSDGQGERYQSAIIGDATAGSGRDIMAGLAAVQAKGFVDDARVAVDGWSWGGVMTAWLIGHHDWCAAIPGALVVDFANYYNESETGFWIGTILGSPYRLENRQLYLQNDPATYLDKAKTPTLIWHNAGDPNAPVTQAYALYHALRENGVKTRFVIRDVHEHAYGDPFQQNDLFQREIGWLSENCTGHAAAAPAPR